MLMKTWVVGRSFIYRAQAYVLDDGDRMLLAFSQVWSDTGNTMSYDLLVNNINPNDDGFVLSDGEIEISWEVDANCLEGDNGEEVYFEVMDQTLDQEITKQDIDDPSEYLVIGTFENDNQLNFDESDHVELPTLSSPVGYDWTVEFWSRPLEDTDSEYGSQKKYFFSDHSGDGLYYRYDTEEAISIYYTYTDPEGRQQTVAIDADVVAGDWTHFSVTSSYSSTTIYIDGIKLKEIASGQLFDFDYIGHNSTQTLYGAIAHFRIWENKRSTEEVKYNYLYGMKGDEQQLAAYYILEEGASQGVLAAYDEVTTNYNANIINAGWTDFIIPTEDNQIYTYTDMIYVDHGTTHNFTLKIFEVGSAEEVCPELTYEVSAMPLNTDALVTASQGIDPSQVVISWDLGYSDWADGYYIFRRESGSTDDWLRLGYVDAADTFYIDAFDFNSSSSLEIGKSYDYRIKVSNNVFGEESLSTIPTGYTFDYSIDAGLVNDTVQMSWTDVSSFAGAYDTLKITLNGEDFKLITDLSKTTSFDPFPVFGETHVYGLVFVKNGEEVAGVYDTLTLWNNGVMSGRVTTRSDDFPLEGVTISMTGYIDDVARNYTTATDSMGYYTIPNIYYSDHTDFRVEAILDGHSFVNSADRSFTMAGFDRVSHELTGIDFESILEYAYDMESGLTVSNLQRTVNDTLQFIDLSWDADLFLQGVEEEKYAYFNLYRDGEIIETICEQTVLAGSNLSLTLTKDYRDYTVNPGSQKEYVLVAYVFKNQSEVYLDSAVLDLNFDDPVSNDVSQGQIIASQDTGVVKLEWQNATAWNIDGYVILRDTLAIDTIADALATAYVDLTGEPGQSYEYKMLTFLSNDNDMALAVDTVPLGIAIYPDLVIPNAIPNGNVDEGALYFDVDFTLAISSADYNFDGVMLKRDNDTLALINKAFFTESGSWNYSGRLHDRTGQPGSYGYEISLYKAVGDEIYTSSPSSGLSTMSLPQMTAPLLVSEGVLAQHVVSLSWTYDENTTIDSVSILREGTEVEVLPVGELSYIDVADEEDGSINYQVQPFASVNGSRELHTTSNTVSASVSEADHDIIEPEEVFATYFYTQYVELTWSFPDYFHANLEIARDGQVIATLDREYRSYKDYDVIEGQAHSYQIRSVYEDKQSDWVSAVGEKYTFSAIHGRVLEKNASASILGAEVLAIWQQSGNTLHWMKTATDSAGHYMFDHVPYVDGADAVVIRAIKNGYSFLDASASVETQGVVQEIDLYNGVSYDMEENRDIKVSEILAVSTYSNEVDGRVEIRWIPESDQYDGFYVFRNYNAILDVQVWDEDFVAFDETGSSANEYIYSVQAYYNSPSATDGESELSEMKDAEAYTTYPGYSQILNFHAVEKLDSNQVELYWSHYGDADKFEIYRSDVLLTEIDVDDKHEYIDLTGAPGNNYKYSIRAYSATTGEYTEFESIDLTYPDLVAVSNLDAITDAENNQVVVSWSYTGKSIDGYYVYRNETKVAELDSATMSWADTSGIPQTWHEYEVAAFRVDDETNVISAFAMDTALFPIIRTPQNVLATATKDSVIQVSWEFDQTNVEGFSVRRVLNGVEESFADVQLDDSVSWGIFEVVDEYGLPETNYDYVVYAYDYRGEELVEYFSESGIDQGIDYPNYPSFSSNTTASTQSYIELSWSYDWGYVDGFTLVIDDTESIDLDVNTRSYHHHINDQNECSNPDNNPHSYVLIPYRIIDDATVVSSTELSWSGLKLSSCSGSTQYLTSVVATQGTHRDKVRLKWGYTDPSVVDFVTINKTLDGVLEESLQLSNAVSFYEDDDIHDGYEYIYEIVPRVSGTDQLSSTASGWSRMVGTVVGQVATYEGNNGVPNVEIRISAEKDGVIYNYVSSTDSDGIFNIDGVFVHQSDSMIYQVTAIKGDHEFLNNGQEVAITPDFYSNSPEATIYDLQSTTIFGEVSSFLGCGQDSVEVTLYQIDANLNPDAGQNVTTESGSFSFTPIPMPNLTYVAVVASPLHDSVSETHNYWHFAEDSVVMSWADIENEMTKVSFEDTTNYDLQVSVKNGCGFSLGDYSFQVDIESKDGCYYGNYDTDYAGNLSVTLPPDDYVVRIMDVSPLDAQSQAYIDYFRVRSQEIDIESGHRAVVELQVSADDPSLEFVFHKTPRIEMTATFDDIKEECTELMEGINVVTKGLETPYDDISFTVLESYDGADCQVNEGYIQVKNEAAANTETVVLEYITDQDGDRDTVDGWYVSGEATLNSYSFFAGDPYPVAPYLKGMTIEYWAGSSLESAEYMQDITELMFVQGESGSGDNKDVIVASNEYDEINLPLFILRDPPGDKSYSYVKAGTKIKRELQLDGVSKYGYGINTKESFPIGVVELRAQQIYQGSEGSGYGTKLSVELEIKEELKTQGSAVMSTNQEGYIMGSAADVVVGMGIALSYGINENIRLIVDDATGQCGIANWLNYSVSADEITTTWIYTRSQIEKLIENYYDMAENDSVFQDGELINGYVEETADNWEEILNVLDVKSLPHYQLCLNEGWEVGDTQGDLGEFCTHFFTSGGTGGNELTGNQWGSRQMELYNELTSNYADKEFDDLYEGLNKASSYETTLPNGRGVDKAGGYASDLWADGFSLDSWKQEREFDDYVEKMRKEMRDFYNDEFQAPVAENYTFGANTSYKKEVKTKMSTNVSFKQHFSNKFKLGGGFMAKGTMKYKAGSNVGATTAEGGPAPTPIVKMMASSEFEYELGAAAMFDLHADYKSEIKVSDKTGFSIDSTSTSGFYLSDDDDGDQFSVTVVNGINAGHTPYFELLGGRSSCPYEDGTIDRDQIYLSIVDDEGNPTNSAKYDLDPDEMVRYNLAVSNNSYFNENRWVDLSDMHLIDADVENISKIISGEKLRPTKRVPIWVPADSTVVVPIEVQRLDVMAPYEYDNIRLLARPYCEKAPFFGDTIKMEAYFVKPCSEVMITEPENGWVIGLDDDNDSEGEERVMLKIQNYRLNDEIRYLDSIAIQYRKVGDNSWIDYDWVSKDELESYYQDYKKIYRQPTYPFIWNISGMPEITDGNYELRALSECNTQGYALSNVLSGTVNRTPLEVEGFPEPLDTIYSFGDAISVRFIDAIDKFDYGNDNVVIYTDDSTIVTEYEAEWGSRDLLIFFKNEDVKKYDGQRLTVHISGLEDVAGNVLKEDGFEDGEFSWSFRVDYFNKASSPVELITPDWKVINNETLDEVLITFGGYDVYEEQFGLDSLIIEYRHTDSLGWTTFMEYDRETLSSRWTGYNTPSKVTEDTSMLNVSQFADGQYFVRVYTQTEQGQKQYSAEEVFIIDQNVAGALVL